MKSKWTEALENIPEEEDSINHRDDGWLSFEEFRKEISEKDSLMGALKARGILQKMIKNNIVECKHLHETNCTGRKFLKPFYRLVT